MKEKLTWYFVNYALPCFTQVIYHCTIRTLDGVVVESTRSEFGGEFLILTLLLLLHWMQYFILPKSKGRQTDAMRP